MNLPSSTPSISEASVLYARLLQAVRGMMGEHTQLAGIASGGAWLAQQLHADLSLGDKVSVLSSALHRDDFAQRGLSASVHTQLHFDVNGADIIVLDDVLYTGRTVRAVLNELYDYGRPARVRLAVLVDRGGRQLPIAADFAAERVEGLGEQQILSLQRDASAPGGLRLELRGPAA